MSEGNAKRVRVTLRWLQILDALEGPGDDKGEFKFTFRVSSANGDLVQETRLPEQGHISISDHPSWNKVDKINKVIFDGQVEDHLGVELMGEEVDLLSANDHLETYRREFNGDPEGWAGSYKPGDEGGKDTDPENLSNWRVGYDIEIV
jgi:hypothetical protein